jgi:hypothetical protein
MGCLLRTEEKQGNFGKDSIHVAQNSMLVFSARSHAFQLINLLDECTGFLSDIYNQFKKIFHKNILNVSCLKLFSYSLYQKHTVYNLLQYTVYNNVSHESSQQKNKIETAICIKSILCTFTPAA